MPYLPQRNKWHRVVAVVRMGSTFDRIRDACVALVAGFHPDPVLPGGNDGDSSRICLTVSVIRDGDPSYSPMACLR